MHLQLAAAELVTECHGLDRGQWISLGAQQYLRRPRWHIGAVADLLVQAGIDTTRFDGRAIAKRLTRHTVERGLNWPNRINTPIPFLRNLLACVDWSLEIPAEPAAVRRARRRGQQPIQRPGIASGPGAAERAAEPAGCHAGGRDSCFRPTEPSLSEELAAAAGDVCVVCSHPGTMRYELPLPMAACDQCWDTMGLDAAADDSDHDAIA
ncbi:hypothetical protein ACWIG5_38495 [Streptomyces lydicus]